MVAAAKPLILAAASTASAAGMVERMVSAASLVSNTHVWTNEPYGIVDDGIVGMLESTLAAGQHIERTRAVLLGALAAELVFADRERHLAVSAEAELAARAAGDPDTLARVLNNLIPPSRADFVELRRERAHEIVSLAEQHGLGADVLFVGHHHLAECHIELAELDGAWNEVQLAGRALEAIPGTRLAQPTALVRSGDGTHRRSLRRGPGAGEQGPRAAPAGPALRRRRAAAGRHGGDRHRPWWVRGDGPVRGLDRGGRRRTTRALGESMAFATLEIGRRDLAEQLVAPFGPSSGWPDDWTTLFCQTAALHVRIELDDRTGADAIATLLTPFPHRWTNAGSSPIGMGPVCMALASYAEMCGDGATAAVGFADAVRISEGMRAPAWLGAQPVPPGLLPPRLGRPERCCRGSRQGL